jgi:hypothetical protein
MIRNDGGGDKLRGVFGARGRRVWLRSHTPPRTLSPARHTPAGLFVKESGFRARLERHGRCAVDELVEEYLELATCAVDDVARPGGFGRIDVLEPRELALDFVGEGDDGVEPDHLDRARRLVRVHARVLERRRVSRQSADTCHAHQCCRT